MLREISIENVAVIEKATAIFSNGFTVLTGETGAGKSILIDSINAILGNRVSRDIVRNGAAKASIWASFSEVSSSVITQLDSLGYPTEDDLLIYREISSDGKSSCRINGLPATVAILKEVCANLINIHGQHDNQNLLNPARHIDTLDSFAQNQDLLQRYSQEYKKFQNISKTLSSLAMDETEKNRKLDLLRYEVDEINSAELTIGEEDELLEQRDLIRNAQTIISSMNHAYLALTGGDEEVGATTLLGDAANQLTQAAQFASDLTEYSTTLHETYYTLTEIASDIQSRLTDYDFEGGSLDEIESRLDLFYKLKQKYGTDIEGVIAYGENATKELETIESSEEQLEKLEKEKEVLYEKCKKLADELTQSRLSAFESLNILIRKALDFLNMPGVQLTLQHKVGELGANGQDICEFYISTNPGESPKAMAKIASGGELSRIMLAIKSALADKDDVATVIYDEIDTGISGLAAGRIGRLLQSSSKGRQVICVTHTAQVAAYANKHLLIEKNVENGRTFTEIRALEENERTDELARIISGDAITELSRANAQEMLRIADEKKV